MSKLGVLAAVLTGGVKETSEDGSVNVKKDGVNVAKSGK